MAKTAQKKSVDPLDDDLRVFTSEEVMERLAMSPRSLTRALDRGELRAVGPRGPGKKLRIPASSVRAYLEGGR